MSPSPRLLGVPNPGQFIHCPGLQSLGVLSCRTRPCAPMKSSGGALVTRKATQVHPPVGGTMQGRYGREDCRSSGVVVPARAGSPLGRPCLRNAPRPGRHAGREVIPKKGCTVAGSQRLARPHALQATGSKGWRIRTWPELAQSPAASSAALNSWTVRPTKPASRPLGSRSGVALGGSPRVDGELVAQGERLNADLSTTQLARAFWMPCSRTSSASCRSARARESCRVPTIRAKTLSVCTVPTADRPAPGGRRCHR